MLTKPDWLALYDPEESLRCLAPTCEATFELIDAWKKKKRRQRGDSIWVYGWAAKISVPAEHYDEDGFSILLRMAPDTQKGSFQVWNMNFWNFYQSETGGLDILLHSKHWTKTDRIDTYSFLIVAERLSSPEYPSLLFWDTRRTRHQCFDPNKQYNSGRAARNDSSIIIETVRKSDRIHSIDDVSKIVLNKNGLLRIRDN